MFERRTKAEIAALVSELTAQVERRTRAALTYRDADREVRRLTATLNGLVPGSQDEVSVNLCETTPALPRAD